MRAAVLLAAGAAACAGSGRDRTPSGDEPPPTGGEAAPAPSPPAPVEEVFPFWGVADLHVDLPFQVHYKGRSRDLGKPGGEVTAQSLRDGCVRLLVLSIYTPSGLAPRRHTLGELTSIIDTSDDLVELNPTLLSKSGGPVRVVYGIEGAQGLVGHADQVPALVARGVLLFGLVHAHHNDLADSATDRHPGRGGLTAEGTALARAIYAAGGLVDVSHMSDEAFADVAALAAEAHRPIVATHSNARALVDHPRNLTDDQLRAIAASGGMVGVNFHSPFLRRDGGQASVEAVVQHILYMNEVMGSADHIAIGSDLDGLIRAADGLETHAGVGDIVRALKKAEWIGADIRAVMGENALRVLFGRSPDPAIAAPLPSCTTIKL